MVLGDVYFLLYLLYPGLSNWIDEHFEYCSDRESGTFYFIEKTRKWKDRKRTVLLGVRRSRQNWGLSFFCPVTGAKSYFSASTTTDCAIWVARMVYDHIFQKPLPSAKENKKW